MSDDEYDPYPFVATLPNGQDVFWWELKAPKYRTVISSKSDFRKITDRYHRRLLVSLTDGQVPPDDPVYLLFHNSVIVDNGSWARMNATLRQLYLSSLSDDRAATPLTVKLGRGSSSRSMSSLT
jgi:hypothetical protein